MCSFKYTENLVVLGMCAEDSFGPGLSSRNLDLLAARALVQVVDDVVVVVGSIIVHISVLKELWPNKGNKQVR